MPKTTPASDADGRAGESASLVAPPPQAVDETYLGTPGEITVHEYLYRCGLVQHARKQIVGELATAAKARAEVDDFLKSCTFTPRVHHTCPSEVAHRRVAAAQEMRRRRLAAEQQKCAQHPPNLSEEFPEDESTTRLAITDETATTPAAGEPQLVSPDTTANTSSHRSPSLGLWRRAYEEQRASGGSAGGGERVHLSPDDESADSAGRLQITQGHNQTSSRQPTSVVGGDPLCDVSLVPHPSPRVLLDPRREMQIAQRYLRGDAADVDDPDRLVSYNGSVLVAPSTFEGFAASHRLYQDAHVRRWSHEQALKKKADAEAAQLAQCQHTPAVVIAGRKYYDRQLEQTKRQQRQQEDKPPNYLRPIHTVAVDPATGKPPAPFSAVKKRPATPRPNEKVPEKQVDDMVARARERAQRRAEAKDSERRVRQQQRLEEELRLRRLALPLTQAEVSATHQQSQTQPVLVKKAGGPRHYDPSSSVGTPRRRRPSTEAGDLSVVAESSPPPRVPRGGPANAQAAIPAVPASRPSPRKALADFHKQQRQRSPQAVALQRAAATQLVGPETAADAVPPRMTPEECQSDPFLAATI
jgi:hypothetical protein